MTAAGEGATAQLTLVIATSNRGKLAEFRALLAGLPLNVVAISDVLQAPFSVVEDRPTFAENAIKKAEAGAALTAMVTLADDSGLEVDVLDGRPGVRSARFAHERATDAENNAALLAAIEGVADSRATDEHHRRTARFRCAIAIVDPYRSDPKPHVIEGVCEGEITTSPRGTGGFGYDPLFVVAGTGQTMAELSESEKNELSHRGRAMAALRPLFVELLGERAREVERIANAT